MAVKQHVKGAAPAKPATRRVPSSVGARRAERNRGGAPAPELPAVGRIKVRATQVGWYGLQRRREGDVFFIDKASEFSERWMEQVDRSTPLKKTGAQEALDKKHDEILGGKAQRPANEDDDDVE